MRLHFWQSEQAGAYPFSHLPEGAFGLLACQAQGVHLLQREQASSGLIRSWCESLTAPLWLLADQQDEEGAAQLAPYCRELGGRLHSLLIGDQLPGIHNSQRFPLEQFRPQGFSEGERAACWLFKRMAVLWQEPVAPEADVMLSLLADFAARIRPLGDADFIYADGQRVFVHCHRQMLSWRKQATGGTELSSRLHEEGGWQLLEPESLLCFEAGELQGTHQAFTLQLLEDDD